MPLSTFLRYSHEQDLGSSFLFLVLVVTPLIIESIDRNFGRAALWCVAASSFSWLSLIRSPILRWGANVLAKRPDQSHLARIFGGASRARTDDLIVANDALSQLSYSPKHGLNGSTILAALPNPHQTL